MVVRLAIVVKRPAVFRIIDDMSMELNMPSIPADSSKPAKLISLLLKAPNLSPYSGARVFTFSIFELTKAIKTENIVNRLKIERPRDKGRPILKFPIFRAPYQDARAIIKYQATIAIAKGTKNDFPKNNI